MSMNHASEHRMAVSNELVSDFGDHEGLLWVRSGH